MRPLELILIEEKTHEEYVLRAIELIQEGKTVYDLLDLGLTSAQCGEAMDRALGIKYLNWN